MWEAEAWVRARASWAEQGAGEVGVRSPGGNTEQQEWAVSTDSDLVASGTKASPYLPACSWAPARQWEIFFLVCFSIWETLRQ